MTASTASRFRAAVDRAMTLDPAEIFRAIQHDAVDSGLRAATYEARVQGTTTETVTERTAERHIDHPPDTGRHVTDMIALRRAGDAWLDVVAEPPNPSSSIPLVRATDPQPDPTPMPDHVRNALKPMDAENEAQGHEPEAS